MTSVALTCRWRSRPQHQKYASREQDFVIDLFGTKAGDDYLTYECKAEGPIAAATAGRFASQQRNAAPLDGAALGDQPLMKARRSAFT